MIRTCANRILRLNENAMMPMEFYDDTKAKTDDRLCFFRLGGARPENQISQRSD